MTAESATPAFAELRDRLIRAGRLLPTAVDGLYGRDAQFEAVARAISNAVTGLGAPDQPEIVDFPPVIPTVNFDALEYLGTFPQLAGLVYSFEGDDRAHNELVHRLESNEPIGDLMTRADTTLTPACCYPIYPMASGPLPPGGRVFQLVGYCFRHEPSIDPMRMQAFRQFENVRLGNPEEVASWRMQWLERAAGLFEDIELDVVSDYASDAFFGRRGRLMSRSQQELQLKTEFLVNVYGDEHRTACASVNYHQDHFGHLFGIESDGSDAHSCCIGFGLERCTVALFAAHGMSVDIWPSTLRTRLFGSDT